MLPVLSERFGLSFGFQTRTGPYLSQAMRRRSKRPAHGENNTVEQRSLQRSSAISSIMDDSPLWLLQRCTSCGESNQAVIPPIDRKVDTGVYCLPCWYNYLSERGACPPKLKVSEVAAVMGENTWRTDDGSPNLLGYTGILLSLLCARRKGKQEQDVALASCFGRLLHSPDIEKRTRLRFAFCLEKQPMAPRMAGSRVEHPSPLTLTIYPTKGRSQSARMMGNLFDSVTPFVRDYPMHFVDSTLCNVATDRPTDDVAAEVGLFARVVLHDLRGLHQDVFRLPYRDLVPRALAALSAHRVGDHVFSLDFHEVLTVWLTNDWILAKTAAQMAVRASSPQCFDVVLRLRGEELISAGCLGIVLVAILDDGTPAMLNKTLAIAPRATVLETVVQFSKKKRGTPYEICQQLLRERSNEPEEVVRLQSMMKSLTA